MPLNPYEAPLHGRLRRTVRHFPLAIRERRSVALGATPSSLDARLQAWATSRRFEIERRSSTSWVLRRNFGTLALLRATFAWHVRNLPMAILVKCSSRSPTRVGLQLICRFPLSVATSGDSEWLSQLLDDLEDWITLSLFNGKP
jgi:hypothetical protein